MSLQLKKIFRLFSDGEYFGLEHREDTQRLDAWIEEDFGWDPVDTVGLTANFGRGIGWSGVAYVAVAAQNVVLTNNATNYIQRTAAGVLSGNTSGFTPTTHLPVCQLVTVAGEITTYVDHRAATKALVYGLAPLASPAFTGVPTAPTAAPGTNSTQIATTAYADAIAALKANIASPTFTGVPAAPTAALGTDTTQLATTSFVQAAINAIKNGVSAAFDTLAEIATELALKAPLASPTFTGTPTVPDEAYHAANWNGSLGIPTKNAIRDKFESLGSGLITVRLNSGADVGTRARINFIEGANVTITAVDDAGDGEIDVTIESSGGGGGGTGVVVQVKETQTTAVATGTTVIPLDDTIPQNTEGTELSNLSTTITPTSATNKLLIEVHALIACNAGIWAVMALFQDATAGALAAAYHFEPQVNGGRPLVLRWYMTAGTTSATTFKVRAGPHTAGGGNQITLNGNNAARLMGGVAVSSMTVVEIDPTGGAGSAAVRASTNDYRLTGVTATPVMTADSTALSTIYLTPFKGDQIALYTGSAWALYNPGEISLAVTGRTTDLPFDIFAYDNAGTVTLEFLDWTNATTRATALVRQNGVWCKTGALTRRYLGTCRPRGATSFHWVREGTDAPCKFDLFNADNRVRVPFRLVDTTDSHNYTTNAFRQWNGSTNFQIDIVAGLQEECFEATAVASTQNNSGTIGKRIGIGYDSTTASAALTGSDTIPTGSVGTTRANLAHFPAIGRHFYAWLQFSNASGTTTWYGDAGTGALPATDAHHSGVAGTWIC